jgi:membrane protease YdiL (CAAX protease family)
VGLCHVLTVGGIRGFGLAPVQLPKGLLLGLLAFLLIYPILHFDNIIVSLLYQHFQHEETVHETIVEMVRTPDFNIRLTFALIAGFGAPLAEEFFFRGVLQTALIQRGWGFIVKFPPDHNYAPPPYQRWIAIVVCSLLFCSLHSVDHFPILFILSLALGYLYERTGNLWASITLHAAFNWTTLILVLSSSNPLQ